MAGHLNKVYEVTCHDIHLQMCHRPRTQAVMRCCTVLACNYCKPFSLHTLQPPEAWFAVSPLLKSLLRHLHSAPSNVYFSVTYRTQHPFRVIEKANRHKGSPTILYGGTCGFMKGGRGFLRASCARFTSNKPLELRRWGLPNPASPFPHEIVGLPQLILQNVTRPRLVSKGRLSGSNPLPSSDMGIALVFTSRLQRQQSKCL